MKKNLEPDTIKKTQQFLTAQARKESKQAAKLYNKKGKRRTDLYKTEMCRSFTELGFCKYNEKCQFCHTINEIRSVNRHPKYKTVICRTFWQEGNCPYGQRCCFTHQENLDLKEETEKDAVELSTIGPGMIEKPEETTNDSEMSNSFMFPIMEFTESINKPSIINITSKTLDQLLVTNYSKQSTESNESVLTSFMPDLLQGKCPIDTECFTTSNIQPVIRITQEKAVGFFPKDIIEVSRKKLDVLYEIRLAELQVSHESLKFTSKDIEYPKDSKYHRLWCKGKPGIWGDTLYYIGI